MLEVEMRAKWPSFVLLVGSGPALIAEGFGGLNSGHLGWEGVLLVLVGVTLAFVSGLILRDLWREAVEIYRGEHRRKGRKKWW